MAAGSASELEYHFLLAHDLHLLDSRNYSALNAAVVEVKRMLSALARKVDSERFAG
jgi:four helix bundle protein